MHTYTIFPLSTYGHPDYMLAILNSVAVITRHIYEHAHRRAQTHIHTHHETKKGTMRSEEKRVFYYQRAMDYV